MMSVVTVTPYPSLGVAAREARSSARAEKRRQSRSLNALRRLGVCIAVVFAVLGAGGGTAQAWPWDVGDQVTAFITNFCGPEDVPQPSLVGGVDNTLGLNKPATSELRGTVIPDTGNAGSKGLGIDRLNVAYNENPMITKPSYERYGFSSLRWTNYGSGCFSVAYWFNPIANFALNLFVHYPMIIGMAVLKFALGTSLYQAFALIITPFISVFTAIFTPWIYFIAPIGVFWAWMRSKGSLQVTLKAAIWVLCIYGVFAWMGNNTSRVVVTMNNFVTEFANGAASKINEVQGGPQVKSSADDPTAAIDQALWHGVPYQTWLLGEVGPDQAKIDQEREKTGQMGWGPAILNGLYIGNDEAGKKVSSAIQTWNSLSYAPEGGGTKTNAWTSDGGKDAWANIPFLYNVKLMCNDDESGSSSTGTGKPEKNRWMYGGSCDAAGAGTQAMVPYFQGKAYDAQLITAFSGGFAALSVTTAVTVSGTYLAIQKMTFFFLLLFSPVFLAISTFADPKRRRFATRYFEIMAANVIKQCVAVCAVLFVANAMSTLLYPPSDVLMPEIPWLLKPFAAFLFFLSMLLLVFPMMSIVKAAAKGDTSVIDKTAAMPSQAGKAVGKAAVVGAAIMATGGFGAGAAGALGGNGQAARMLTQAGRLAGGRGGVGKMLNTTGRALRMRDSAVSARSQQQGVARAREAGTMAMLSGPGGQEYIARLAKEGMVDTDGNLTKAGFKRAQKDFMKTVDSGVTSARAAQLQDAHMKQYFAGYRAENNGQHHPLDPTSPENKKAAAIAQARERQEISNAALFESKRDQGINKNIDPNAPVAPVDPNAPADPNAPKTEEEAKKASQAAMAAAARERVNGPKFAQDTNIRPNVTATPQDVLATNGITRTEAVEDPTKLLTGDAYEGGDTSKMNPLHPSTAAMNELRFAMLNGTDEDIEKAALKASEAIAAHGVPEEISSVQAVGETAAKFQAADIIGPMPNTATSANWKERAEDASSMQAAIATMPVDHPAGDTVRAYVSALSNPAVDAADVEALKVQAIKALGDAETVAPSQESLFAAGNNPEAATDPALTAGMVAPGATATKTAQAVDVNGVKIAADSSFAQIDRAVETLPEDHPAQASYAAYLQALESGQSTDGQIEAARQNVLADLGGESLANEAAGANVVQGSLLDTPTPLAGPSDSAQPALFDAQGATPDATASVATATPEGFRATSISTSDGTVVQGIEPVSMAADGTPVEAPQGFVSQVVTGEDGTRRELFVAAPVTSVGDSAPSMVASAPVEVPEGFRETTVSAADGTAVQGIEPISVAGASATAPVEAPQGFVPQTVTSEDGSQRDIFVAAPVASTSTDVSAPSQMDVPEGFRETTVPVANGESVRGIEPVAQSASIEAPQGFVAQAVQAEDGTTREVFVPASADSASMNSSVAPEGFRETVVSTADGEAVRGFEPTADMAGARVEAPQGFVAQSITADDGSQRELFVPEAVASAAAPSVPEGFRETVVPSASGDVVRGIEPVMDASASRVDAPQGFVPQTVQAEDGTSREVFIPAAVTTEAPEGFRETSIPTASGETVRGIEPISMDASTPTEAPQGFVPTSITSEDGTQRDIFVPAPVTAPEGFRETAVPTADGDIVRGFEPVVPAPADTTPVEAPQGFVAQTVVTDDGARDIFVPAPVASADTASAPMDSLAAPAEAPAGFREAAVPTESGEVVRGFEPIAADAAVEAPQGFVQQSVRAEDGTSRDIFVPQADVTPAFEQPTIAEMVQPTTVAPEGFRETTVQGVDGETVRGFEPTTAHDAPIEAPQGFVAQSVMTDDGGFRGASVETATGEVVNGFEPMDAHQAAPEGFTPQVVEAADGSQRELFVPSSDQPDTSSASAFVAAPALSFGENGGDVQRDNAPSRPMTQDALFDEGGSVTPEARQSSSFAATEHQAPQEPLFGANDTPAPVAVSMESTRDDISHAVEALPESHPARESFARFEEASASLPSADVEERRQEVLSDLGVTSDGASAVSMVTSNDSDGRDDRSYQQDALFDVADNGSHDQGAHDDQWNPPMGSMNHESIGGVQYGAESMGAPSFAAQDAPVAPLDAPQQPSSWREDVQPLAPATPAIIDDMGQEASAPQPTADYEPSATSSAWGSDYDAPAAGAGDNREFITTPVVAAVPATTNDEPAPSESDNDSNGDDLHQGPSFDPSVGNNDRFIPAGGIRGERADAPSFAAHDDGHSNEADQLGWRGDQRDDYGQRYQADQQPTVIVAEAAGATADHGGYEDRGDTHFTPAYQQVDPDGYGDTRDALYGGQQPQDVRATIDRDDLRMAVREVAEDERRNGRPDQPAPFEARPWADETPRYAEQSGTGFEQASTFEQAPAQQQFDQAPVQQEFHQVDAPAMGQQNVESVSADRGVDLHSADQQRTAATPAASAPQPVIVTGDEDVVEGAPQDVLRVPLAGDENGATEPWRRSRKRRISDFFNPGASNEDGDATTSDETPSVEGGSNESDRS